MCDVLKCIFRIHFEMGTGENEVRVEAIEKIEEYGEKTSLLTDTMIDSTFLKILGRMVCSLLRNLLKYCCFRPNDTAVDPAMFQGKSPPRIWKGARGRGGEGKWKHDKFYEDEQGPIDLVTNEVSLIISIFESLNL